MTNNSYVLIVDDEEELRENLFDLLELEGYEVATCKTGGEALKSVESRVPDLVLLDIQLPEIDGIEILRQFKERHPNLPVIMVSASSQQGTREKIEEYDADGFILKPYDQDELLALIESLLKRGVS